MSKIDSIGDAKEYNYHVQKLDNKTNWTLLLM